MEGTIKQISEYKFRFYGDYINCYRENKSVVVDGEEYYRSVEVFLGVRVNDDYYNTSKPVVKKYFNDKWVLYTGKHKKVNSFKFIIKEGVQYM
jgi:hypothetical protein